MSNREIPPLESLLEHRSWVRSVARRLLRDEHAADDLAQEAWTRALRSPPDPDRDPKPWLRRVLKNLASNRRRDEARRQRREADWRDRRVQRTPAELVAEAEQHRRLVGLVLDLEEPFKTVLVLRYYEGLGPKDIAKRLAIPVGTVHSRSARAVERLKERMDGEERGDRRAWVSALAPLAGLQHLAPAAALTTAPSTLAAGAMIMSTKTLIGGAAALLLTALLVTHLLSTDEEAPTPQPGAAPGGGPPTLAGRKGADVPEKDLLAGLPPAIDLDRVDRNRDLHGVVVRMDGTPVGGARLQTVTYPWRQMGMPDRSSHEEETLGPSVLSAHNGTFALRLRPGARVNLRVDAQDFAVVELRALNAGERVRIVLMRGVNLSARVRSADGTPVDGARVRLRDWGQRDSKGIELQRLVPCGTDGVARLDRLPVGRRVSLMAEHDVLGSSNRVVLNLVESSAREHTLTFAAGSGVSGRVTDAASGEPLSAAWVVWGRDPLKGVRTDTDGHYALPPRSGRHRRATARAEGYQSSTVFVAETGTHDFPLHRGATLVGRVVSADGQPVEGAQLAGLEKAQGTLRASTVEARSEPDGSFRLAPVRTDKMLRLVIWAAGHGRLTTKLDPARLSPGEVDLGDVVLPESRAVAGVVQTADGEALGRVRVAIGRLTRLPMFRHDSENYAFGTQDECWTDDLGRFRFIDMMPGRFRLTVEPRGQNAFATDVRVLADEDLEDLQLTLPQGRHLRVTVETQAGTPLPGVEVSLWAVGSRAVKADCDANGLATLKLTGPAQSVSIRLPAALRGKYAGVFRQKLDVSTRVMRFVLHAGLRTRGRIVDQNGQPGAGLYVYVHIDGEQADTRVAAKDGTFEVTVPTKRPADLVVTGFANVPMKGGGTRGAQLPVEGRLDAVTPGAQDLILEVTRRKADRTLRIRVVMPSGEPAPEAFVMFQPGVNGNFGHVKTDKEGRAQITGLAPVPMTLTARYWSQDVPNVGAHAQGVVPEGQEVVLHIQTGHELTGWVFDADKRPIFQAEVNVRCASGTTHTTKSRPDGSFRFRLGPQDGNRVTVEVIHTTKDGQHLSGVLKDVVSTSQDLRLFVESAKGR